jgi:tRNA A37 threonylcarbamoyladenosine dehydratase
MSEEYWQERTELLLGKEALERLAHTHILVAGLGGVGAYAAEMLCRAGIGEMTLVDADSIHPSNRNRQLIALKSNEGKSKANLMAARLRDINPDIRLHIREEFIKDEKIFALLETPFDYIIDAIDTLAPKIFLIKTALERDIPIISSMGSGGKTDPAQIRIADFSETYNDKLARMLRKRMHKMGIRSGFKVVFSPEQTQKEAVKLVDNEENKKTTVGTISYMPPMFGSFMAAEVLRELAGIG